MARTAETGFLHALAAAALSRGLRGVVCFDAAPDRLLGAASAFERMLAAADGCRVRRLVLGSGEQEEGLWTALDWAPEAGAPGPRLVAGWLAPPPAGTLTLVVIPDLARLSVVAARAVVTLVGADVAHVERDGLSMTWAPTTAWLAGCATAQVGRISPHLLDRFALRLRLPEDEPASRVDAIRERLRAPGAGSEDAMEIPGSLLDALRRGGEVEPTRHALTAVLELVAGRGGSGARREVALARLATATAQLDGARELTIEHVNDAADLIGIAPPAPAPLTSKPPTRPHDADHTDEVRPDETPSESGETAEAGSATLRPVTVLAAPAETEFEPAALGDTTGGPAAVDPYPEDDAPVDRDPDPLREPPVRRSAQSTTGKPIGVQRARGVRDLALAATVFEAAKFQALRRRSRPDAERLLISPADLRTYRRSPPANEMLALVLDFTCRSDWTWPRVLRSYLLWAYPRRASVCLIRVGAADAANELRAEHVLARNLLDPRLGMLLEVAAGRATPLAHGLELAHQTLRHALHHLGSSTSSARLVVVSDGRGNVPLSASLAGRIDDAVGGTGVADALAISEQLAAMQRVRITVVDPDPAVLADLPADLARALGAELDRSLVVRPQVTDAA